MHFLLLKNALLPMKRLENGGQMIDCQGISVVRPNATMLPVVWSKWNRHQGMTKTFS